MTGRHQGDRKGPFGQPKRHQGGRKGLIGQLAKHQGGRKGSLGQPARHQGGTREVGKSQLDSLGRQERTIWTAWEAPGRQERINWEAPGRLVTQDGRSNPGFGRVPDFV